MSNQIKLRKKHWVKTGANNAIDTEDLLELHKQYEKPSKLRKPAKGIYGQPMVEDLDKEGVE